VYWCQAGVIRPQPSPLCCRCGCEKKERKKDLRPSLNSSGRNRAGSGGELAVASFFFSTSTEIISKKSLSTYLQTVEPL